MSSSLTEAYYRRLKSFDSPELEEFYDPSQPRDKEGQWTKLWSGVSPHPDRRVAPKAAAITKARLVQSPEHIARQIYDGDLGNGFRSELDKYDGVESHGAGGFVDTYLTGSILRKDGMKVGYWKRHMFTDDDGALVAEHQELFLDPQYQGRGIADRFNAHAIAKYQKYGVDRIELEAAADVGGYAWARQGFRFKGTDEERRDFLNRQLDRTSVKFNIPLLRDHRKQLTAEVETLRRAINAGEDVQPIHIASIGETYARYAGRDIQTSPPRDYETWPGKELLLGTQWNGVYYFDANSAVTAAATSLEHVRLRPAYRDDKPVVTDVAAMTAAFDPRQPRDKDGKWTVSVQHVANPENAAGIMKEGFRTDTPEWSRWFGDGVYLAEAGDQKGAKKYARQGGREWRTSQIVEGTASFDNPLIVVAKNGIDVRVQIVEGLGGKAAVAKMAADRYERNVETIKTILREELEPENPSEFAKLDLSVPEQTFFWEFSQAAMTRADARIAIATDGDTITTNGTWRALSERIDDVVRPTRASDQWEHMSEPLGNLVKEAGHDALVIETERWAGIGGRQIVAFDPSKITVQSVRPYYKYGPIVAASGIESPPFCQHGILDFACHSAACRPPTSGGTGGSRPGGTATLTRVSGDARHAELIRQQGGDEESLASERSVIRNGERFREIFPEDLTDRIRVRVGPDTLKLIAESGGVKTIHDDDTPKWNQMITKEIRGDHERTMFGEDTQPVYGYVQPTDRLSRQGVAVAQYGQIAIVLKKDVAHRTTVTMGDSLDQNKPPAPVLATEVHTASNLRLDSATTEPNARYIEAQIHGGIKVSDIERIEFHTYSGERDYVRGVEADGYTNKDYTPDDIKSWLPGVDVRVYRDDEDFGIVAAARRVLNSGICAHGMLDFACHDASCRPPTSGGTGGSKPKSGGRVTDVEYYGKGTTGASYEGARRVKHEGSLRVADNMTDSERETIRAELDHEVVDQEAWATEPFSQAVYMAKANMGSMEGMTVGMAVQLEAVYDRFEDDYPVMDKVQALMSDYNGDREAFSAAVHEITGVSVESGFVSYINSRWANSSVDTDSMAMQLTVASLHELGGAMRSLQTYRQSSDPNSPYQGALRVIEKAGGALKAVAKATYRTTQEALEDRGVTEIELIRGVKNISSIQADKIIAQPNPLSSWTTDRNIAMLFSGNGGSYVATVPASQVYSLSNLTGNGALKEHEVIVLGKPITAKRISGEEFAAEDAPVVYIDHDDPDWLHVTETPTVKAARKRLDSSRKAD